MQLGQIIRLKIGMTSFRKSGENLVGSQVQLLLRLGPETPATPTSRLGKSESPRRSIERLTGSSSDWGPFKCDELENTVVRKFCNMIREGKKW